MNSRLIYFVQFYFCEVFRQGPLLLLLVLRYRRVFSKTVSSHHLFLLHLLGNVLFNIVLRIVTYAISVAPKHNVVFSNDWSPTIISSVFNRFRALVLLEHIVYLVHVFSTISITIIHLLIMEAVLLLHPHTL